jgi:hypothetical protein
MVLLAPLPCVVKTAANAGERIYEGQLSPQPPARHTPARTDRADSAWIGLFERYSEPPQGLAHPMLAQRPIHVPPT